jgi:endonuclease III
MHTTVAARTHIIQATQCTPHEPHGSPQPPIPTPPHPYPHHPPQVPSTFEQLEALPGVGHKTASVVMSQAFG